ncbi:MAG TPA: carboxypeptidase regulatory-like domain-containing protein [Longimicrobium sp.]|nr:carboxypeptidase regulatory-like domain-containing protein [Longimicrobium sp.]
MRMTFSHALALAATLLAAAPATAQQAQQQRTTVHGQVVDTRSGQPVAHAAVYLGNDRTVTIADAEGRFELKRIRPGSRAVWAEAPGYTMEVQVAEIPSGEANLTLQMQSDPVRLATLTVTTSRLDRRARAYAGTARVFRESDLASMWYNNVQQLVESRGSVRATACPGSGFANRRGALGAPMIGSYVGGGDCIYARGSTYSSRVFIDEMPWVGGLESLSDFQLAEVARVEIYGHGREVHVFTRQFMNWLSRRAYVPTPIGLM